MDGQAADPHSKLLISSGALSLVGLSTAVLYMLHSTPYTMVAFLVGGVALIGAAVAVLAFVVVSDLRARLASLSRVSFRSGEVIVQQGENPEFMYVIGEGQVEFIEESDGEETQIAKLGPADYFGDLAILSDTPYRATARAATDVELMRIGRREFRSLYSHLPRLRRAVHDQQQRRKKMLEEASRQNRHGGDRS